MKIEKENMTVEDTMDRLVEKEGGITCGCEKPSLKMVYHIDGTDFYSYSYRCDCGNSISVSRKRENEVFW